MRWSTVVGRLISNQPPQLPTRIGGTLVSAYHIQPCGSSIALAVIAGLATINDMTRQVVELAAGYLVLAMAGA